MEGQDVAIRQEQTLALPDINQIAEAAFKSAMFRDLAGSAQAVVKILAGQELGLPPMYSLQRLYVVQGKVAVMAETMGMLLKKSGKYSYKVVELTDKGCVIDFFEKGEKVYTSSFTEDDARRAELLGKDVWKRYPRAMYFSRCLSQGARIVGPDAIGGVYTKEELESIPDAAELKTVGNIAKPEPKNSLLRERPDDEVEQRDPDDLADEAQAALVKKAPEQAKADAKPAPVKADAKPPDVKPIVQLRSDLLEAMKPLSKEQRQTVMVINGDMDQSRWLHGEYLKAIETARGLGQQGKLA